MEEDVTKIYEEYSEELLFCKYFIAEKLKHHAEMGRCGENILKKCLQLVDVYKNFSYIR